MKTIAVLYATREGHTRRIASYLADTFRAHGLSAHVMDVATRAAEFCVDAYSAAVLCASVHGGRHEQEMIKFVKQRLNELDRIPTAFISVSLSQAGAQDAKQPPERRDEAAADVKKMIELFLRETGWRPSRIKPVAGALAYTKYNFLLRFIMKRIARKAGADTDTSRDFQYTDWATLDRFVEEF